MNYKKQIQIAQIESTLSAQKHSIKKINLEVLKLTAKLKDYETSKTAVSKEIEGGEKELAKLKGGDKQ